MTAAAPDIRTAALKADVITTETIRIEGSLRAIRDVGGMNAVEAALNTAKRRVILASNDNEDWVA
ncbi:hypothetical protein [Brevundimonas sp. FT23028]|uniref:hypothetical protein n=1 Tax=Brevundimonas sp. FT23028 TaxID=3393748 RepID=UPI003B589869